MRHRSINRNSVVASGSSFFNGWRSTPGTTPLTSQLVLLISTTTTKVEIGSNAARLRLRSLTCGTGQPPSVRMDDEGATTSAAPPHSFSHLGCMTANCRMRSSACDTLIRLCARHVLCWPAFPLVPALRSIDSAAADSAADCSAAGRHIVRRLPSYYGEVRLLVPVHHRLRLLVFPMRTIVLGTHSTPMARPEISQLPMRSFCT